MMTDYCGFCRNRVNGYEFAEFSDEENEYNYHNKAETGEEKHFLAHTFGESEKVEYNLNSRVADEVDSVYASVASESVHTDDDDDDVEEKNLKSDTYKCDLNTMDNQGTYYVQ